MKVIKLYLKYFFSLSNVIILILLQLFMFLSYFVSITNLNNDFSYENILQFYFENSLYYTKLILILFSTFIFMKLNNERNEYILNIVITAGCSKTNNYKYMMITNIILIIGFCLISFLIFLILGFTIKNYFYFDFKYIITLFNLMLLSIYYGLLSYFITLVLNNQFIYIIIIIMFFISELFMAEETVFKYIYLYFFPNINNINGELYVSNIYLIIINIVLYFINKIIYINKDLKN